jgi:N-acetylglucosamine-6-sulfatase
LQAVDDLVEAVVYKLEGEVALENTYVVFTSDNGQHLGEHRIQKAKNRPYEESVHVPLLIRGPRVQARPPTNKLVLNTDFFPTFTDLAGIQTPDYVDGRSLRPLLEGRASPWRTAILLEHVDTTDSGRWFYGIRTSDGRKYVEYEEGFRELYDLEADPYELANSYYDSTTPPMDLARRLEKLKDCAEDSCRAAEDRS